MTWTVPGAACNTSVQSVAQADDSASSAAFDGMFASAMKIVTLGMAGPLSARPR